MIIAAILAAIPSVQTGQVMWQGTSPPWSALHSMALHASRNRVVLFGGGRSGISNADT